MPPAASVSTRLDGAKAARSPITRIAAGAVTRFGIRRVATSNAATKTSSSCETAHSSPFPVRPNRRSVSATTSAATADAARTTLRPRRRGVAPSPCSSSGAVPVPFAAIRPAPLLDPAWSTRGRSPPRSEPGGDLGGRCDRGAALCVGVPDVRTHDAGAPRNLRRAPFDVDARRPHKVLVDAVRTSVERPASCEIPSTRARKSA